MHPDDPTPAPSHLPAPLPSPAALLQRTQGALELLRDVVQESSAEYWYERGCRAFGFEDHLMAGAKQKAQEAISAFDECLKSSPNHANAFLRRGNVNYQMRQYENALADYKKAISINAELVNKCVSHICECGFMEYSCDDSEYAHRRAEKDFSRALQFQPENADALYQRGYMRYSLDRIEEAMSDYQEAISLKTEYQTKIAANIYHEGSCKLNWLGNSECYSEAAKDFSRALSFSPQYALAIYGLGRAKFGMNDFIGAINDFNSAILIQPSIIQAFEYRAMSKKALGDLDGYAADNALASHLTSLNKSYQRQ